MALAMLVGLGLTGCPTGAELDTPYEEYEPIPTTVTNTATATTTATATSTATSTTSGPGACDNSTVDEVMHYWCGTPICHGDIGVNNADAPLWLFSPNRATELLDLPATEEGCTTELVINTTTPEQSLIITSMKHTTPAACGIEMPKGGFEIPQMEYTCIEQWVYSLVAAAP
ncbi:MAG TPA: hypothetical protein VFU02_23320 [Polyangiaceae bacterium]|nr:hypothetical protein [Polyangiaceae bacterium]